MVTGKTSYQGERNILYAMLLSDFEYFYTLF